jgi:hypothetical protein
VGNTQVGFGEDTQSTDVEVDHIEVSKTGGIGMACAPTPSCDPTSWASTWKMYNMSFHDNYVHETGNEGFYLGNTQNYYTMTCSVIGTVTVEPQRFDTLKFYNNILDKCGWTSAQISRGEGWLDIHDNVITNYGYVNQTQHQAGIIVGGISHGHVYNNKVIRGTGNAFQCFGSGLTTVSNNIFAYAGYDGTAQGQNAMEMDDRPAPPGFPGLKVYVVNNTIISPKRNGISLYDDYGTVATGNIMANNIITGPGFLPAAAAYIDLQDNVPTTLYNNLQLPSNATLKFVDTLNNDYHILANSPAVDAGTNGSVYGVTDDMDHNPRPYGASYDIGAYEYNGGVAPPPVANAGGNHSIVLPVSSFTLNGSGSTDAGGTITTYAWTQVSGPNTGSIAVPSAVSTVVSNLVQGTYQFKLIVTDDNSQTASDIMTLVVNPAPPPSPPVANAGGNQTITLPASFTLSGSKSTDATGTILTYAWVQLSGPNTAAVATPGVVSSVVSNLQAGTYQFKLTVTDNNGLSATDIMTLVVNAAAAPPPANKPPVAVPGPDQHMTGPAIATLDGSASYDPDGTIAQYSWAIVSGPGGITVVHPGTSVATIYGLQPGAYKFQLTVTDNSGASAVAMVTIYVGQGVVANNGPVAIAGNDTTIAYPGTTAVLNGSASYDAGGTIGLYSWRQISGAAASVAQATSAATGIGNLAIGVYTFELTVTDNNNLAAKDTVKVTVVDNLRHGDILEVYPNPFVDNVTVNAVNEYTGKVEMSLYSIGGGLLKTMQFDKQGEQFTQTVSFGNVARGAYVLSIRFAGDTKPETIRLIRQ